MESAKDVDVLGKPKGWGARHSFAMLGFFGMALIYAHRFNLSMAIVVMVIRPTPNITTIAGTDNNLTSILLKPGNGTALGVCADLKAASLKDSSGVVSDTGEFEWSGAEQGLILGSFFWGYAATQFPGGVLSAKYGGKWVFGIGMFLTSLFAVLTPPFARIHRNLLILARIIQGIGQGVLIPTMHTLLAKWSPAEERSTLSSLVYAGCQFGTAVCMLSAGYMIDANIMGGWPSVFYIYGGLGLLWLVFWFAFMAESPETHPGISSLERNYIQKSIGVSAGDDTKPVKTPWSSMLTSVPVWAIMIAHTGHAWGMYTLLAQMPTYMKTILHFDMKQNSLLSATPYIAMWLTCIITCRIADAFISRRILSKLMVRKLSQAISQIGPAITLVWAAYTGCDRTLTVVLLTVGIGINGMVYAGFVPNFADIAPRQAGVLMGITNTMANIAGFLAPFIAGLIIDGEPSLEKWRLVFFLSAAVYVANAVFFGIFASADEQPWNNPDKDPKNDTNHLNPSKPLKDDKV